MRWAWRLLALAALSVATYVVATGERRPIEDQPYPDAVTYVALAHNLADGEGWGARIADEREETRYPPGLPILLAPFTAFDLDRVAVAISVLLVGAVWLVARHLGGDLSAAVAVLVLVSSETLRTQASFVMSDIPATLATVLALGAVTTHRNRLAGVLIGVSTWLRLANVAVALGLKRRGWVPFAAVILGLVVTKVAWGWGYAGDEAAWSPGHIWSVSGLQSPQQERFANVIAYPAMLLGLEGELTVPGTALLAGLAVWRRPERWFVLAVVAGTLAVYLPYSYQAQRFMFAPVAMIAVYAGVWISDLVPHACGTGTDRHAAPGAQTQPVGGSDRDHTSKAPSRPT